MAINTELFEKIKQHILEKPRRYDQGEWGKPQPDVPCGTACCIAGWAAILGGINTHEELRGSRMRGFDPDIAAELLGLTEDESDVVFDANGMAWAEDYGDRLREAKTPEERADAAAEYIDHIIATNDFGEVEDSDDWDDEDY